MLAQGASLLAVILSFCGKDSTGRAWMQSFQRCLGQIPTYVVRRRALAHWLRSFEHAQKSGGVYKVRDHHGFVGHDFIEVPCTEVDPYTGEVYETALNRRGHCPAHRGGIAGGLAARDKRAPRTLRRYRAWLKKGPNAVMRCKKVPYRAIDAVLPKTPGSTWAYAHLSLPAPPSAEMRRRWGEHDAEDEWDLLTPVASDLDELRMQLRWSRDDADPTRRWEWHGPRPENLPN